jgi:hypothetical protein
MKPVPAAYDGPISSVTVSVEIPSTYKKVFSIVSDPFQSPNWAQPIKSVRRTESGLEADYELPMGVAPCAVTKEIDEKNGVIDVVVRPPVGREFKIHSRVIALDEKNTLYVFTLQSPPIPKKKIKNLRGVLEMNLSKDMDSLRSFILTGRRKP